MLNRNVMIDGRVYDVHELRLVTFDLPNDTVLLTVRSASSGTGELTERTTQLGLRDGLTVAQWELIIWASEFYAEWRDEGSELLDGILSVLTDEQAELFPRAYPEWAVGVAYAVGNRTRHDGRLWRCVQAHTSQEGWEPPTVPALWVRTSTDEWPEWVQPTGAHDAYGVGDRVAHGGSRWVSTVDANTWEPGVYGWNQA